MKKNKLLTLFISVLLLFTGCGATSVDAPHPASGMDSEYEDSDAMFMVVLAPDQGALPEFGEPAKIINAYEQGERPNYTIWLVPLRDGVSMSVENTYDYMQLYREVPYEVCEQFTAVLGEYYQINTFVESWTGFESNYCVRIVAHLGNEQAMWLFDPERLDGDSGEYESGANIKHVIWPRKIPDGLDDFKMRVLSEAAAGAVWLYADENGWGGPAVTPEQLAGSEVAFMQTLFYATGWIEHVFAEAVEYDEQMIKPYTSALFPGVHTPELPDDIDMHDFTPEVVIMAMFSAASSDGETGHVVVKISYENENGEFEDFLRVDWEADEYFDIYRPFSYRLKGVYPMERLLLGGHVYEEFNEKYLRPAEELNLYLANWTSPEKLDPDTLLDAYQFSEFQSLAYIEGYEPGEVLVSGETVESYIRAHLDIPVKKLRASTFYDRVNESYLMRVFREWVGVDTSIGELDKWGAWRSGDVMLLRALGYLYDDNRANYLLISEDGDRFSYLALYSQWAFPNDWPAAGGPASGITDAFNGTWSCVLNLFDDEAPVYSTLTLTENGEARLENGWMDEGITELYTGTYEAALAGGSADGMSSATLFLKLSLDWWIWEGDGDIYSPRVINGTYIANICNGYMYLTLSDGEALNRGPYGAPVLEYEFFVQ
jgi:hypothetical protein